MIRVVSQIETGKYTLLQLSEGLPNTWCTEATIDGKTYKTEIVYDLPNHIAIVGHGDFTGKEVVFN